MGLAKYTYSVSLLLLDQSAPAGLNSESLLNCIKYFINTIVCLSIVYLSISRHRLLNFRDTTSTAQRERAVGPALIKQEKTHPVYILFQDIL